MPCTDMNTWISSARAAGHRRVLALLLSLHVLPSANLSRGGHGQRQPGRGVYRPGRRSASPPRCGAHRTGKGSQALKGLLRAMRAGQECRAGGRRLPGACPQGAGRLHLPGLEDRRGRLLPWSGPQTGARFSAAGTGWFCRCRFARIVLRYGRPLRVPGNLTDGEIEAYRMQLEQR